MLQEFNFEVDETVTIEKVIRAAYLNPNRKSFKNCTFKDNEFVLDWDCTDP